MEPRRLLRRDGPDRETTVQKRDRERRGEREGRGEGGLGERVGDTEKGIMETDRREGGRRNQKVGRNRQ